MSPNRPPRDVPASVRARLRNLARRRDLDFTLGRYAAERFLYRLSASDEMHRFTLKGAALFRVWAAEEMRPTRDVDFLAAADHTSVRAAVEAMCAVPCPDDGVVFDAGALLINTIRVDQPDGGLRARLPGALGNIRLSLQMDIGLGDMVTPARELRDYPTLLDLPAPRLWTYPREAMVAEKFHAMVSRGEINSRVKDLWDIACLARRFAFDGETLRSAVAETFRRSATTFTADRPPALRPAYYEDPARRERWRVLYRQIPTGADGPARLADAGVELSRFLGPLYDSLIEGTAFPQTWPDGGPWRPAVEARTGGGGGG